MKLLTLGALVLLVPTAALADKSFTTEKAATWDCTKDATVVINHGNGKYTFKGPCKDITVNGGHNTLTIETVTALTVNGSSNTITADSLDSATFTGSENKLTWKKSGSAGGKPEVTSLGQNNTITQGK
jgi:hypothetical protein